MRRKEERSALDCILLLKADQFRYESSPLSHVRTKSVLPSKKLETKIIKELISQ